VSDAEVYSAAFAKDPYPFYARWREEAPAWWSDELGGYVLSRYSDVRRAFGDGTAFRQSQRWERGLTDALGAPPLVALDPPLHTVVRKTFGEPFRPRALEEGMAAAVTSAVAEIVDGLDPDAPFELNRDVSLRMSMAVIATLIGSENSPELGGLYSAVLDSLRAVRTNQADGAEEHAGREAGRTLIGYLTELRHAGVNTGGLDLICAVLETDALAEPDIVLTCANLLIAGVETTVGGVATAMAALLTDPQAPAAVRADPSLLRRAFDEGLRWMSPVQMVGKQVTAPVTLGGRKLEPGDEVVLVLGSANRDPERYAEPDRYWLDRPNRDHIAFGSGAHLCLGAPLARLEARVLMGALLDTFGDLSLAGPIEYGGAPSARAPLEVWLSPGPVGARPPEPALRR
jgi:cytochrome P450